MEFFTESGALNITFILAFIVSIIFFLNKVLVLDGQKSGWLMGAIAAFLAIAYLILLELYIFTVAEGGLMLLGIYGFMRKEHISLRTEQLFNIILACIMILVSVFAFAGLITVIEFTGSITMLLGAYWLTHESLQLGWFMFFIAHLAAAHLGYVKDQNFFGTFQIASMLVALVGIIKNNKKRVPVG